MNRGARPWLFGVAAMPYGAFNGVVAVALPFMLRRAGLPVERIAAIAATVQVPAIWYVLWAPIVDWRFRRRTWIVLLSVVTASLTAGALCLTSHAAIRAATALFVAASALAQPISSAVGGLVAAVMPVGLRDRTAGWTQAGILGAGVAAGALVVALAARELVTVAVVAATACIALPSTAALVVDEPTPTTASPVAHLRGMFRALGGIVRQRRFWLAAMLFLSPAGAGALMNLFSGVAPDFRASPTVVVIVVAVAGVLTAGGALLGGYLLSRVDRWRAYPIAGLLTSVVVGAMLFAPFNVTSYVLGAACYAVATGLAYTAYMALALELVGGETAIGGTLFTLFTAAVNVPVVYMLRLDGLGHARWGLRGMLGADAVGNLLAAIVLLVLISRMKPISDR